MISIILKLIKTNLINHIEYNLMISICKNITPIFYETNNITLICCKITL